MAETTQDTKTTQDTVAPYLRSWRPCDEWDANGEVTWFVWRVGDQGRREYGSEGMSEAEARTEAGRLNGDTP